MKKEEKNNFIKLTQRRGVSLIVLIVTIIVVIILSVAVILTLSNNNPIESAREVRFKANIRNIQDELSMYLYSENTKNFGDFEPSNVSKSGDDMVEILSSAKGYEDILKVENGKLKYIGDNEKEEEWFVSVLGSNVPAEWRATIKDVTSDGVPIPKGFTYVTGTKATGTVIQDDKGNEFVWVPATETTYVKDLNFPANATPTREDELPDGIIDETYDVKKYGGFYIARYEAGVPDSSDPGKPVSKKGANAWMNIDYLNAKILAESMISNEYIQTGLLTGRAWDTTCHWIKDYIKTLDENSALNNSVYYGNYKNSTFKYINSSNEEVQKESGTGICIPTGSSEYTKTKNIYDLAGNVWEWSNEVGDSNRLFCRGGDWSSNSGTHSLASRFNLDPHVWNNYVGFRERLYIK